jgi:hypothetical protein
MFRFEHPDLFWLAALPVLMIAGIFLRIYLTGKNWSKWGSKLSVERILARIKDKPSFLWLPGLAVIFLCIAAVNPQWGYKTETVENNQPIFSSSLIYPIACLLKISLQIDWRGLAGLR